MENNTYSKQKRAFELYLAAAQGGDERAYFKVAEWLRQGIGCKADPDAAVPWFRKAIMTSDPEVLKLYNEYLDQGIDLARDPMYAYSVNKALALFGDGDIEAVKRCIGLIEDGKFDPESEDVIFWYEKAADILCRDGSTEQWPVKGLEYYYSQELESANTDPLEMLLNARIQKKDFKAVAMLMALTAKDHVQAARHLCELLIYGDPCDHFDFSGYLDANAGRNTVDVLVEALRKRAMHQDPEAYAQLAMYSFLYYDGTDPEHVQTLLNAAAEGGYAQASEMLSALSADEDVWDRSEQLFRQYSAGNDPDELYMASRMAAIDLGTVYDPSGSLEFLYRAAEAGNVDAMLKACDLFRGFRFLDGLGEAIKYASLAALEAEGEGFFKLAECFEACSDSMKSRMAYEYYVYAKNAGYRPAEEKCEEYISRKEEFRERGLELRENGRYQESFNALYPLFFMDDEEAMRIGASMILGGKAEYPDWDVAVRLMLEEYKYNKDPGIAEIICMLYAVGGDKEQTAEWAETAAAGGYPDGYYLTADLCYNEEEPFCTEYMQWIKKGADAGSGPCMYKYALAYYLNDSGNGISPMTSDEVFRYASGAYERGVSEAMDILVRWHSDEEYYRRQDEELSRKLEAFYAARDAEIERETRREQEQYQRAIEIGNWFAARTKLLNSSFEVRDSSGNTYTVNPITDVAQGSNGSFRVNSGNLSELLKQRQNIIDSNMLPKPRYF